MLGFNIDFFKHYFVRRTGDHDFLNLSRFDISYRLKKDVDNMSYVTKEEFNRHKAELTETIKEYNEAFGNLADAIKSLTNKIKEHDEWLEIHNENFETLSK